MRSVLRKTSSFLVSALLIPLLACLGGTHDEDEDQFREDTLTCEEALAHLQDCCPGFDPTAVACRYYYESSSGCGTSQENREEPAFNKGESRCIRNKSCAELNDQKVCDRAQKAVQYIDRSSTTGSDRTSGVHQSHPPVCP